MGMTERKGVEGTPLWDIKKQKTVKYFGFPFLSVLELSCGSRGSKHENK